MIRLGLIGGLLGGLLGTERSKNDLSVPNKLVPNKLPCVIGLVKTRSVAAKQVAGKYFVFHIGE
jgi:hypothetical protein